MKIFLTLSFLLFASVSMAGTCTSLSRSNYSANSILTSSALNLDFNTIYGAYNSIDGGCVQDGTLEFAALNASDFGSITSGVQQGCALAYSDSNTISVGKCIATVNGFSIKTTVPNTVTWGCSSCSSETTSTQYYLYIKTGSTGTTLNLLISTTAPGVDGYDASSNKVIGRFYNNSSSDIDTFSIESWSSVGFIPTSGIVKTPGLSTPRLFTARISAAGVVSNEKGDWISGSCAIASTSQFTCAFVTPIFVNAPNCILTQNNSSGGAITPIVYVESISTTQLVYKTVTGGVNNPDAVYVLCHGD